MGPHRISRLVLGDNPIYGYSHFNHLLSQHQREYHTPDRVLATLRRAEEVGITAWQSTMTDRSLSDLHRYREQGGRIQWLCLSTSQWYDEPDRVAEAGRHGPIGMAPHGGGVAGRCLRENRLDHLRDILKRIRDTGCLVGLSAHDPHLVEIARDEDWDVDYFMTALYNLAGANRQFEMRFGHPPLGEVYLREDRDCMLDQIRRTPKPCIAYKVLAAGRTVRNPEQVREEIGFAIRNIKPTDAVLIGMYQQFGDQIGQNASLVSELGRQGDLP